MSDVFISYRRETSTSDAYFVHDGLERRGYDVFLDRELRSGVGRATAGLSGVAVRFRVAGIMVGLRMYSFMNVMVDVWNCALSGAAFNPSWHLTRRGRRGCNRGVPCAGSLGC